MQTAELNDKFSIPGVLVFNQRDNGLIYASIDNKACKAEIYLQGAHLTKWQPEGEHPVIFLSQKSFYTPGKAIRGGIPIIFPWFGARTATAESPRTDGPSHGFARTSAWDVIASSMSGSYVNLQFRLLPNAQSRELGYDNFELLYKLRIGSTLELDLILNNQSNCSFHYEEALHTYLAVSDVEKISIDGLGDTDFYDKTDNYKLKHQSESFLVLRAETDRPYIRTASTVIVSDPELCRRIAVEKSNSQTTVIWNPWIEQTAKLADMNADEWRNMVCVEAANVGDDSITIPPGGSHTLKCSLKLQNI